MKRHNRNEIKQKVENILKENGKISLRETAKKLGNSCVSKTLTEVVEELENEGIVHKVSNGRTSYIEMIKKYKKKK